MEAYLLVIQNNVTISAKHFMRSESLSDNKKKAALVIFLGFKKVIRILVNVKNIHLKNRRRDEFS